MKTKLYLTRHGQTEWNVEQKLQGHQDSPLTEQGINHAAWLSESLRHVNLDIIYASSSPRTLKTADILRYDRAIDIVPEDDLREISMGSWEGQRNSDIESHSPDKHYDFWNNPHLYEPTNGGETYHDLQQRVLPKVQDIISRHTGKNILIVTHAAALKTIMTFFEGRELADLWTPPILHSTALCKVVCEGDRFTIELYGDTSHYKE
ncbi:histidine phosphatase family protein [Paenibacillus paeoniae]|uniref:Histidine phosphatase family protein n=1 Tax=Paenibacillus paeoniae TaxID=2292705 RepID=A0A371P5H4_9BACL|nr:histidine phosphatase family protein [Paenibacillus paeoniae]REK71191.1 histidine phosphatase family protein [Paenibacillus paeoniae]